MSIAALNYWTPMLHLEALRGFPAQQVATLQDRIISFELEDDYRLNDKATLTLDNSDGQLLDLDSLALGAIFNVSFGYPGAMTTPRALHCKAIKGGARIGTGGRTAATAAIRNSGSSSATGGGVVTMELWSKIWGLDLFRARAKIGGDPDRQLVYTNKTIPDIVRDIAGQYGYKGAGLLVTDLEGEAKHESYTIPAKMSAAEWVHDQAKRRRWVFSIDADGFHFHPPRALARDAATIEHLRWFMGDPDVIEWSVDGDLRVPQAAEVVGMQNESRYGTTEGADLQSDDVPAGPDAVSVEPGVPQTMSSQQATRVRTPIGVLQGKAGKPIGIDRLLSVPNPTRRQREQAEAQINRGINRWILNLTLIGNPRVHARKPLSLSNFGPMVDGVWWTRKAIHAVRPGLVYQTRIECARKAPTKGAGNLIVGKSEFGQVNEQGQDMVPSRGYTPIAVLLRN